jgi:hypothetical protein
MLLKIEIDLEDMFDNAAHDSFIEGCEEGYEGRSHSCNLKESVKQEIINSIKSKISKDCISSVESKSKDAIEKAISESVLTAKQVIEDRALQFVNEWLEKKTVISDKWGDPVNELTISELIKQQFDDLLERKVTKDGKFSNGYGAETKLINYLVGDKVKEEVGARLSQFNRDIDNQIKAHIESGIKESVSNKFAEMVIQTAKSQNNKIGNG